MLYGLWKEDEWKHNRWWGSESKMESHVKQAEPHYGLVPLVRGNRVFLEMWSSMISKFDFSKTCYHQRILRREKRIRKCLMNVNAPKNEIEKEIKRQIWLRDEFNATFNAETLHVSKSHIYRVKQVMYKRKSQHTTHKHSSRNGKRNNWYKIHTRGKLAISVMETQPWSSMLDFKNSSFTKLASLQMTSQRCLNG